MKGVRISGREDDSTEQILSQLHRLVSARPPGPDNKPGQVCAEILASIREAQGARAPEVKLSRAQRRELQALSALYAAARGHAAETRKLDLRLMSALPGSTRIVEDLKERGATAKLDAADIVKDQQIWARLGSNEKGELNRLAEALGVGIPDFLEALASSSLAAAAEFGPSPLRRHAMDAVILGVMLAVLLMLADQPAVSTEDLRRVVGTWRRQPQSIVAAYYEGIAGVPAIFPREDFSTLTGLRGDAGARALLKRGGERVIRVPLPAAAIDIDTPEDLLNLQNS